MKGIVFNVVESIIEREFGGEMWDTLIDEAKVDGAYTSLGNYPDEDLYALIDVASRKMDLSASEMLKWIGRRAMPRFQEALPYIFENYHHSEDFIKDVNNIIHPEVKKLYPGAICPHFHMVQTSQKSLMLVYKSSRKLCALAEGFMESSAALYGNEMKIQQTECIHEGKERCVFVVEWVS